MKTHVKLRIADAIIFMQSNFSLERLTEQEEEEQIQQRFKNFFYNGNKAADIIINVTVVDKLPQIKGENVFITRNFEDNSENWRLLKKNRTYIYKSPLEGKKQVVLVKQDFSRAKAFLLPKKLKGKVWYATDLIYDFLQVLLINYFSYHNKGIFTHAIGVKDRNGRGLLFAGKSGAGKSTTARIWHKYSKAMVLNDDRVIVRKTGRKFFIYGSPWHGEFSDYLESRIESAPLEEIFFIYHSSKNKTQAISEKAAFTSLYPALFPTFWDKSCLSNIASFCHDLIKSIPSYSFGFVNNRKVIEFVRRSVGKNLKKKGVIDA